MADLGGARVGQIAIVCKDVARATAFYRDTLGVRFLFSAGPNLAFLDAGGTRLMLSADASVEGIGTSVLYFFVSDIDAVYESLVAKGVQFPEPPHVIARMPDHELWLAAFRDSEGNFMGVMEERR